MPAPENDSNIHNDSNENFKRNDDLFEREIARFVVYLIDQYRSILAP